MSLWRYHYYSRQKNIYLLEANLALKAVEVTDINVPGGINKSNYNDVKVTDSYD